ncbi:hypothetical protein P152DRAFT_259476 [Eremomyces bilateralis CBS 781.70]|uniref:Uncharacterized protein n=1 Tax=Eremomyces bilateralis CBS 781.70 TaxID=1392243 RepID=A0A6G1FQK4_9PEZI|nr:uncharacterized protein P152DRAFT_259476 [Eremomyces bilateralis CBS 781.70]KAF1807969.1 hypothetical protein P152DRAFT_259476 [Eremomyces bilateralis CBS 781.70]
MSLSFALSYLHSSPVPSQSSVRLHFGRRLSPPYLNLSSTAVIELLVPLLLLSPTIQATPVEYDSDPPPRPAVDIVKNFFGRLGQGASNVLNVNYLNAQKAAYGDERATLDRESGIITVETKRHVAQQPMFLKFPRKGIARKWQKGHQIILTARDDPAPAKRESSSAIPDPLNYDFIRSIFRRNEPGDRRQLVATLADDSTLTTHGDADSAATTANENVLAVHPFSSNSASRIVHDDPQNHCSHDICSTETVGHENVLAVHPFSHSASGIVHDDPRKHGSHDDSSINKVLQENVLAVHPLSANSASGIVHDDSRKHGSHDDSSINKVLQENVLAVHPLSANSASGIIHDDSRKHGSHDDPRKHGSHDAGSTGTIGREHMLAVHPSTSNTGTVHNDPLKHGTDDAKVAGFVQDLPSTESQGRPPITAGLVHLSTTGKQYNRRQLMQGNSVLNGIIRWLPTVEEVGVRAIYDEYRNRAEPANATELIAVVNSGWNLNVLGWWQWSLLGVCSFVGLFL